MKNLFCNFQLALVLLIGIFVIFNFRLSFSQDLVKDSREKESVILTTAPSGGPKAENNSSNKNTERINNLTKELNLARKNNDLVRKVQIENEIGKLSGDVSNSSSFNYRLKPNVEILNEPIINNNDALGFTIINGGDEFKAVTTSTDSYTGIIYAVGTVSNAAGSDTIKIYLSTNNGRNWVLIARESWIFSGVHYVSGEIDAEAVNSGSGSYLFYVTSFTYSGVQYSSLERIMSDGTAYSFLFLKNSDLSVRHYYPRVTSDNANYTGATYVYTVCTQDSLISNNNHTLKIMYSLLLSPFAANPVLTLRNFAPNGHGYWWYRDSASNNAAAYTDIGYADSVGVSEVITVTSFYNSGNNSLYTTKSFNYGATAPTRNLIINETNLNKMPVIAFNGAGSEEGMIVYLRLFSGGDWDPYYRRTTNLGSSWTSGYVDVSGDTAVSADVTGLKGVTGHFKTAYTNKSGIYGKYYTRTFQNGAFKAPLQITLFGGNSFGMIRAGYRYDTDSCLAVWSAQQGIGMYATIGCTGTITGTGNEHFLPLTFKLGQNYPNPFNPVTKFIYEIPVSGFVKLKLYDITGKEVSSIVNEIKSAGNYIVDFDASALPSGVYFYKLYAGEFTAVRKMIILK